MTTPNPARDAKPGWRGTDPDGGTWVLVEHPSGSWDPWLHVPGDGDWHWRTQEQAEAAGLVLLVTRTKVDEVRARLTDMVDEACRSRDQARRERDDAFESGRTEGYRCGWSDAAAPDATIRDAAVSLSYWLAEQLGEHVDDAYDRGETVADTVKRLVAKVSAPAPLHPRQVATAEELDALPDSAVVVDADGGSWQRNGHINCVPMWDRSGESERWTSGEISLPAVVVWIPGTAAPAPLDPGNPEHLRPWQEKLIQVAGEVAFGPPLPYGRFVDGPKPGERLVVARGKFADKPEHRTPAAMRYAAFEIDLAGISASTTSVASKLRYMADRQEARESSEKLAETIARQRVGREPTTQEIELVLLGIRAPQDVKSTPKETSND